MATILQIINADRNLSLFAKGLKESGLDAKLNEFGPFTIIGPVNLALKKLESMTYDEMLLPANKPKLVDFLSGYVLTGKKMHSDFRNDQKLQTLQGKSVTVKVDSGDIHVNGAKILSRDRNGSNGVIHLLDKTYSEF